LCEFVFESGSFFQLKEIGNECFSGSPFLSTKGTDELNVKLEPTPLSADRKMNIRPKYVIDLEERYKFVKVMGESEEDELWREIDSNEEISVKRYEIEGAERSEAFLSEIQALFSVIHPCVLSFKGYYLSQDSQNARLATPYLGNLKEILVVGSNLPSWWNVSCQAIVILGIVLGMKYIHCSGFVHGDLKPENIFLDSNHRIRIGHFGFTRLQEAGFQAHSRKTPINVYESPGSGIRDEKSDVYSFGLIMYEIVSNDFLFSASYGKLEIMDQLRNGWRPDLNKVTLTPVSRTIIEMSWAINPNDRPSFDDIWCEFYLNDCEIIPGLDKNLIARFLAWVESEGGIVDRFD
jgi:serine/threonine protein kinase